MPKLSLPQNWTFRHPHDKKWYPAQMPGCIHTDLLRNGLIPDPFWGRNEHELQWIEEEDWHYRCEFEWAGDDEAGHIDLVAEGLDTLANIKLNGTLIGQSESMFVSYRFAAAQHLKQGRNLLEIIFHSPMPYIRERQKKHDGLESNDRVGGCSTIRKEQCSFGWDWGPRFVTCGVYKPLYLESWSKNRLESVHVHQIHEQGAVTLSLEPELTRASKTATYHARLSLDEKVVAESDDLQLAVNSPQLWWPAGHGEQPLYDLEVQLMQGDAVIDNWKRRLGLRTVKLDRHSDEFGESFQFVVNDRPIFAKGANWIPAHSFVTEVTRADYDDLLSSAVAANMNMIRVWGGGIYEMDDFYDLCDEKGLLLWHDFMFACALYPGDRHFLKLVKAEAEEQVRRLRHHPCMALWCGNNELEMMKGMRDRMEQKATYRKNYKKLFYELLDEAVTSLCDIDYWPSSPHNPDGGPEKGPFNPNAGDIHYWDVWHSKKPVKNYESTQFRFCSEFGMQSYPAPEVAETFCPSEELNVFSPIFENHQKNGGGNGTIFHYVSQRYRYPRDYRALSYLSQINQAYCMKVGVEHWRRLMPRSMGALYWQINDCWPVSSWSSIEFGGRWKALQYEARRFLAPALVTAHVPGEVTFDKHNLSHNSIDAIEVYTVFDGEKNQSALLRWTLFSLDGETLLDESKQVKLTYGQARVQKKLRAAPWFKEYGAENVVLRLRLESPGGEGISENTVFLSLPRLMALPQNDVKLTAKALPGGSYAVTAVSPTFQHQVQLNLKGLPKAKWENNFIDLFPGAETTVVVDPGKKMKAADFRKRLSAYTVADCY